MSSPHSPFLFLIFIFAFHPLQTRSQPFIGINYGQVADNLPPPETTAKLIQSTDIHKVRLYGSDPSVIKSFAGTGVSLTIGVPNSDIPALASDPHLAGNWVAAAVLSFHPASDLALVTVGNEVLSYNDRALTAQLLPAMRNLRNALDSAGFGGKIKVSTVHSMALLARSEPPSSGRFDPSAEDLLKGVLTFNEATGSPFAINPYPYFAYRSDPRPETLAFCLFGPNAGRVDPGSNITYTNMFDAQVNAVRAALDAMGFEGVEIVVAETGWPYEGDNDEVGPSVENAEAYNGNLIKHLRSMVGTPLMPGKSVDTYLFAMYDEDLKPGPTSERSFGLFKTDLSMNYDVGLVSKTTSQVMTPSTMIASPVPKPEKGDDWCVPKSGILDGQLQENLDYACGRAGIDCGPIQPGGDCFEPTTLLSHAAYAMNLVYQSSGKNPSACDFSQTAVLTSTNPSHEKCSYPGGST